MQSTSVKYGTPDLPVFESIRQNGYGKLFLAISATAFVAVCAHVSFRLPFTPVPLTLQDFAVLVVGMVLGPAAGFSVMLLYLCEGAAGMPVFNPIGLGGLAQLVGPTAGYLFSYPLAAAVAGLAGSYIRTRNVTALTAGLVAGALATMIIFAGGAGWISHSRYLNPTSTWELAVAPFLFGALAKLVAAAAIYASTRRWTHS